MNLFDLSLRFKGFPIRKARAELHKIKGVSTTNLSKHIDDRKRGIVNYHLQNNSFYKRFSKIESYNNWNDIPIMTKLDLQIPLKNRLSNSFKKSNIYVNKTSGSSGTPFVFAKDKFCHAMTWSIFEEWYGWHQIYNQKQARFYGIPKEATANFKERVKDILSNRHRFNVFDLSEKAMDSWGRIFSKKRFVFITGYASVITAFAEYLIDNEIVLSNICPSLKACLPTSEMSSEEDRITMERAFGVKVVNEYGAAEFGLIALEKDGEWIINDLNLHVEIVDDDGIVLPLGKEGRIVITDLYNKAHPFIRYELGDIGSIQLYDNGIRVLKTLTGRKEDFVQLPSGKRAPGLAFYYVTKSVMKDDGNVKEIKVIQTALNSFEIHYVAKNDLSELKKQDISRALDHYLEPNINLVFIRKEQLQRTNNGKLQQFTSLINAS